MNIYFINRQIEELLAETDPETGEVLFDPEQLNELIMEKEAATEDLALGYKNLTAEAAAIRAEANAASVPACPAPTTITSKSYSGRIINAVFKTALER